jgi:hypothetical protein
MVFQQEPRTASQDPTLGGRVRGGASGPLAHGAAGPQRLGRLGQAGLRSRPAFVSPMWLRDAHHCLHRAASDRGDREDSPALRAVGRARTTPGAKPDGGLKAAGSRAPRAKPDGRRPGRILSAWGQNSALPPAFPAPPGVRIVPVRTSAVPTGTILLSTWDRTTSDRDFLSYKHPWHTTLSAAQKSKFL